MKVNKAFWQSRYDDINEFESHLARNGTKILSSSSTFRRMNSVVASSINRRPEETLEVQSGRPRRTPTMGQVPGRVSGKRLRRRQPTQRPGT